MEQSMKSIRHVFTQRVYSMESITHEEEYVRFNAREYSPLWSLLADWSKSEDEEEWRQHIPVFTEIISRWSRKGYIAVHVGPEWPAFDGGELITGPDLERLLEDHTTWEYEENPDRVIGLSPGRNFQEIPPAR
ncbi:hypothetical protein [Streptomyces sp. NPDC001678]|uniref:hypothetical protein n=1 Tax=Streptomyces sp. NPDC001678 TaxID=3364599 RepID=UPI003682444D